MNNTLNKNGLKAVHMIRSFLAEMEMEPIEEQLADRIVFHVAFDGPADQGIAQVLVNQERFVFYFIFRGYVPVDRLGKVGEFILRANWRLIEGSFDLDFETGALRYKTGIDFTHAEFTEPLLRNAILSGMNNIERFADGLAAVINDTSQPSEAFTGG